MTILPVDPHALAVATRLHSLFQEAYRFEAEQIGCTEFPPLRETVEDLRQSPDQFIAIASEENIVGVLSFCGSGDDVTITRLVVSPQLHRRGLGTRLLSALEERATPEKTFVTTAEKNLPAVRLYERNGFVASAVSVSREGIWLNHFRKLVSRSS